MRPSATSDDVKDVFGKALANEGLLAMDSKMPASLSDPGPQMRSKTIGRFFYDLGITQNVLATEDAVQTTPRSRASSPRLKASASTTAHLKPLDKGR